MNSLRDQTILLLLLLSSFFGVKVATTQEGSSYFFYQQPQYPRHCKEIRDQCSSGTLRGVHTIKPDGIPQPFEVYCIKVSSGGWTVIQRRIDGSVTFKRDWEQYKTGFGFLSTEFWIGNERLSFLTNQAVYELRIDVTLSNGLSFYVNYNSFRISDEWGQYKLVNAEDFSGNASCVVSTCPPETTQGDCSCQTICNDYVGMTDCNNVCNETCVPNECSFSGSFIKNGESFIDTGCTVNCTCINSQLSCNTDYECSSDASCLEKDGVRRCYCNEWYEGDGVTCTRNDTFYRDCYEAYQSGNGEDGVYKILPTGWKGPAFDVFCNMTFSGGGWMVFQRRTDGSTNFYRSWIEYKNGFGIKTQGNDFWLGNEHLHWLTNQKEYYMLRIDEVDTYDNSYYAEYTSFKVGNESTKYELGIGTYIKGYDYLHYNSGGQFSTPDQDNDGCSHFNCAEGHRSGWWHTPVTLGTCTECYHSYNECYYFFTRSDCRNFCSDSNPNGDYNGGNGENIYYSLFCNGKFFEMKIRPSSS